MQILLNYRFKESTIIVIMIVCLSIACEPSKPPLDEYRLKTTDAKSFKKTRNYIVEFARDQIGCKYKKAGKEKTGFDCSGFVIYVYREFQIPMAANSNEQAKQGKEIPIEKAVAGDLIFFGSKKQITHVGIISLNKKKNVSVIHSTSSLGVIEENILKSDYWMRRIQKVVSLDSYLKMDEISFNK